MISKIALVGAGGFVGSVLRYIVAHFAVTSAQRGFPYATFAVNVAGCLAIGIIVGLSERFAWLTEEWRLLLAVGFCGGFTTFSAFSYESVILLQNKDYLTFATFAILSFAACLAATFLGLFLTKG